MKKILPLFLLLFFASEVLAQSKASEVSIGTKVSIHSKILDQERAIQIYIPESYASTEARYPVLYILDGQRFFTNGVSIQKTTIAPAEIPEMIVVGINSNRESRGVLFSDESEKYTLFLKNEVISYIDLNYRTTDERIIFGWETAAFYASEVVLKEKDLFSGAIASNGGYASEEIVKAFQSDKDIYLYMANTRKDVFTISYSDAFNELLKKNNPQNLIWTYELFDDEVHQTMPYLAMYKGIKYYYHNFPGLIFESVEAYIKAGGMPYLKSYFKERAKRFGGDGTIDNSTKNRLIWLAWNRDNFKYFSFFMDEFKDVLSTKRYASAYWQNRLGQFYLKHKDYDNAIKHFEIGIKKYPNTQYDDQMKKGLATAQKNK